MYRGWWSMNIPWWMREGSRKIKEYGPRLNVSRMTRRNGQYIVHDMFDCFIEDLKRLPHPFLLFSCIFNGWSLWRFLLCPNKFYLGWRLSSEKKKNFNQRTILLDNFGIYTICYFISKLNVCLLRGIDMWHYKSP